VNKLKQTIVGVSKRCIENTMKGTKLDGIDFLFGQKGAPKDVNGTRYDVRGY
jgi:transposase